MELLKIKLPDFQNISYYSAPSNKPKYNSLDEVDPWFVKRSNKKVWS